MLEVTELSTNKQHTLSLFVRIRHPPFSALFTGAGTRWTRQVVEMGWGAECGRCSDQESALAKHWQYMYPFFWDAPYSFFCFLSLSQDWTVPVGVIKYHHTMRTSSRTRHLRNISSVGELSVCVYVCRHDVTYDATIDTGGERNRV